MASISPSSAPTFPAFPATLLAGLDLPGGWKVEHMLVPNPNATGGNFSIGYIASGPNGRKAFLKALDFSSALFSPDPARQLQSLTEAYNFERNILAKCSGLSRVVTAVSDGSVEVNSPFGKQHVPYLIFERADGDCRSLLGATSGFDMAWALRALHHVAVGLQQMHGRGMAHQDVKPSNVLIFGPGSSKIGDLGRAADKSATAPHDHIPYAGDPAYAPPELLYRHVDPDWNARRLGCDCYHLGSMVLFFFMNIAATPAILSRLLPSQRPRAWVGTYPQILPHIRDAFDQVAKQFEHHLSLQLRSDLPKIFRQLCDPDPNLRGHPADRATIGNAYSLHRYVGKLNTLATRAEMNLLT